MGLKGIGSPLVEQPTHDKPELSACTSGQVYISDGEETIMVTKLGVKFLQQKLQELATFLGVVSTPALRHEPWDALTK
jgi:hypothetical protein